MAIFNEILAGRFNRFLQKHLSMKGGPPSAALSSEIQPVFHVEDIPSEHRVLQGTNLYSVAFNIPAVAGQNSLFQIRNPQASGVLVVLEKVFVFPSVLTFINITTIFLDTTDLTNVFAGIKRDKRAQGTSAAINSSGNNFVDLATQVGVMACAANVGQDLIQTIHNEWPILPGCALRFNATTVNDNLVAMVQWRERPLEDSEKAA